MDPTPSPAPPPGASASSSVPAATVVRTPTLTDAQFEGLQARDFGICLLSSCPARLQDVACWPFLLFPFGIFSQRFVLTVAQRDLHKAEKDVRDLLSALEEAARQRDVATEEARAPRVPSPASHLQAQNRPDGGLIPLPPSSFCFQSRGYAAQVDVLAGALKDAVAEVDGPKASARSFTSLARSKCTAPLLSGATPAAPTGPPGGVSPAVHRQQSAMRRRRRGSHVPAVPWPPTGAPRAALRSHGRHPRTGGSREGARRGPSVPRLHPAAPT